MQIWNLSAGVSLVAAMGGVIAIAVIESLNAVLSARISTRVFTMARRDLQASFAGAGWDLQSRERDGHLQELLMTNSTMASQAILSAAAGLASASIAAVLLASAMIASPPITAAVCATALVVVVGVRPLAMRARRLSKEQTVANLELASIINEQVGLAQELYTFGVGKLFTERYISSVDRVSRLYDRRVALARLSPALFRGSALFLVLVALGIVYSMEVVGVASLAMAVLILVRVLTYMQAAQQSYHVLQDLLPWAERIWDTLDEYSLKKLDRSGMLTPTVELLSFENVWFSYTSEQPVIHSVSFELRRGEMIGLIGPSASGKSTLVQLLLRLREPEAGRVLLNGEPISLFGLDSWYERVALVPQEPQGLHGTILENIAFFRDVSRSACERVASLANLHDEIVAMPQGYDTMVGDHGVGLSGGQMQRLAIARALLGQPDLLVLDEPTSALDPISEALIQQTLGALRKKVTMVIIAHRMTTVANCDRLMVLANGQIEAFDTPAEVESTNEYFREARRLSRL